MTSTLDLLKIRGAERWFNMCYVAYLLQFPFY